MKKKNIVIHILIGFFALTGFAQETIKYDETNTWFTVLNRITINDTWSVSNELHERLGAFLKEQETFIFRPSVDYTINPHIEVSIGYSYVKNDPNEPYPTPKIGVAENNIWSQVLLKNDIGKIHVTHRFRQENRWFDDVKENNDGLFSRDGKVYTNRFRYRLTLNTDIKKFENNQSLFIQVFDEIWVPQTKNLAPKSLSRNWIYAGLGYKFNPMTNIQIGVLNQFDNLGNNVYISTPIIQTTLVKNFSL
jgi:hypothetical protein